VPQCKQRSARVEQNSQDPGVTTVDVVVVAYRSADHLRECVEPLAGREGIRVIVVDNACPERSPETVADLPVSIVSTGRNAGFGAGCNAGARAEAGEAILFLNPDATMLPDDVRRLGRCFEQDQLCGAAGPLILETTGETQPSMRRRPTLSSAFAEALYLHHLFPRAPWATELVWTGYEEPREVEWLSGAVLCVRRAAFEEVGGFDERFFMYCEDIDLCDRLRRRGYRIRYEPAALARHAGGGSVPRPMLTPMKANARLLYARLHEPWPRYAAFRVALALNELLRLPVAAARSPMHLRGRLAALAVTLTPHVRTAGDFPSRLR
jgi:N-acetylglucosaminyl-diphospho-decaprenol L-rhamnosyltransferase